MPPDEMGPFFITGLLNRKVKLQLNCQDSALDFGALGPWMFLSIPSIYNFHFFFLKVKKTDLHDSMACQGHLSLPSVPKEVIDLNSDA